MASSSPVRLLPAPRAARVAKAPLLRPLCRLQAQQARPRRWQTPCCLPASRGLQPRRRRRRRRRRSTCHRMGSCTASPARLAARQRRRQRGMACLMVRIRFASQTARPTLGSGAAGACMAAASSAGRQVRGSGGGHTCWLVWLRGGAGRCPGWRHQACAGRQDGCAALPACASPRAAPCCCCRRALRGGVAGGAGGRRRLLLRSREGHLLRGLAGGPDARQVCVHARAAGRSWRAAGRRVRVGWAGGAEGGRGAFIQGAGVRGGGFEAVHGPAV